MEKPRAICLAGPTGSGKSRLAVTLAAALGLEIVNADSRQVYADWPVITAQPTGAQRAEAPHHLYGFLPSHQKISAGIFARLALPKIEEIAARGATALLVGGTGLYFEALLRGMAEIPDIDPEISREIERRLDNDGSYVLHAELARADPVCAARIHPNDRQRIVRALEVLAGTGRPLSWWQVRSRPGGQCQGLMLFLDADLDWLTPRLAARIEAMLAAGALSEAKGAWQNCPRQDAPAMSGIGARETLACLDGSIGLQECRRLWLARTRAYAKRQLTWFRARKEAVFLAPGRGAAAFLEAARAGRADAQTA